MALQSIPLRFLREAQTPGSKVGQEAATVAANDVPSRSSRPAASQQIAVYLGENLVERPGPRYGSAASATGNMLSF